MLENRTVMITGAAGALGAVVAGEFAAASARVIAVDRPGPLDARDFPGGVFSMAADVLDPDDIADAVATIRQEHGPIHGLLCLAGGFFGDTPVAETGAGNARQQMELNYLTAFTTVSAVLPAMAEDGGGAIVCVGSRPAAVTVPGSIAYAASKLAVLKLVDLVAEEYREQGVRANAILPSIIDTPANREAMPAADHDRWVKPAQIAAVLKFLVSDASEIVSGAHIPVYGNA